MVAENLISNALIPLRTSDSGSDALNIMSDFYVKHLPIVNNVQLLGLISEDDILENDVEEAVGSFDLRLQHAFVRSDDHVYEVMRQVAGKNLTVIPVIDWDDNYVGLITMEDLLAYFAKTAAFAEQGGILVLEVGKRDYSLTEISRIVESEGASILSSFISTEPNSNKIEITIKVNKPNLAAIMATFERFDYDIKASFNESELLDSLKDRFDSLMAYLNV